MEDIECAGFTFVSNFDSGNLARVELVKKREIFGVNTAPARNFNTEEPEYEFNVWTKPDCFGTDFENGNRTWFHFGIRGGAPFALIKLNLVDLNKQAKMYSQGMAPVTKSIPGRGHWERIRDRPTYSVENNIFTLSYRYCTPENLRTTVYFAFTYPHSYIDLQSHLDHVDGKVIPTSKHKNNDDIYYVRECVCKTLEGRRVDLITISSHHNITIEREPKLKNLFLEEKKSRPYIFQNKKIIFVSARVHPGETPSSFVFNGFLNFLLNRDNPSAIALRKLYVFKLIPCLNPDGVARGHYRTDTRGINLNRVYLSPSEVYHPSVYAARSIIRYHHYGYEKEDVYEKFDFSLIAKSSSNIDLGSDDSASNTNCSTPSILHNSLTKKVSVLTLNEGNLLKNDLVCIVCKNNINRSNNQFAGVSDSPQSIHNFDSNVLCENCYSSFSNNKDNCDKKMLAKDVDKDEKDDSSIDSGLFLYIDMHGHASKKGIFMYGNHFDDIEKNVECMLLPKLMALNNHNFHYTSCNFTERNMYLRDRRDGLSREGSGRVAVLKLTGLVRSYTLECNYNTGRIVNVLPATSRETSKNSHSIPVPPRYTPHIFEDVGKALGPSILDLTASNPYSRLGNSEFHSLSGLREWLRIDYLKNRASPRVSPLPKINTQVTRGSNRNTIKLHSRSSKNSGKSAKKHTEAPGKILNDRKENVAVNQKSANVNNSQPSCSRSLYKPSFSGGKPTRNKFTSSIKTKEFSMQMEKKDYTKEDKLSESGSLKSKREISIRIKGANGDTNKSKCKKDIEIETSRGDFCDITSKSIIKQGSKRIKISSARHKTSLLGAQPQLKLSEISFVSANSKTIPISGETSMSDSQLELNQWKSCSSAEISVQSISNDKMKSVAGSKFSLKKRMLSTPKSISKSSTVKTMLKKKNILKKNVLMKIASPLDTHLNKGHKMKRRKKKTKLV